ncbi:MAG: MMPL family transporter [Acidimicrobiales bacterium]|nr:MMPL family transporter [Acidimicrobiales bacterium]
MEKLWRNAGVQLGKYWYAVVALAVVITGLLSFGLTQLEFATGQDSYLNPDSQVAIDNVEFQDDFGGEAVILLLRGEDGSDIADLFAGDNLAELERLEAELREIPEVYSVVAPRTSLGYSETIVKENVGTNALLSAVEREPDEAAKAIRQADIQLQLARLSAIPTEERELTNPAWVEFLLFDNTGFVDGDDGLAAPADDDRSIRASLRSTFPNQQTAVGGVLLTGNADLDTLSAGTDAVLEIMDTADLDGFEVVTTGSPVFLAEINDYLQGGMLTLGAAALAVMAVVLLLLFRVRWRLLPLLSVLVGVAWSFALLGFIDVDLSLVTISGLPILIGLGIDFAIQIHNRVEEEVVLDRDAHPMSQTLANLGPALLVATVSGVVAFLALQVSQVPMIRDFGVMLAIGIVVLVFVGIVVPTSLLGVREYKVPTTERGASLVERTVVKLGSLPASSAIPLVIASIALFIGGIALEGSFKIESDPLRWIDQDSQTVADVDTLEEDTGFSSTLGILVQSNNVLADDVAEVVNDFTIEAESSDEVVSSSSLVNTIAKIIAVPGATPLAPTSTDLQAAADVLPPDLERVLLSPDGTSTQVNLRLAPGSLDDRAELVERLETDLESRIAALDLPDDSVLREGLDADDPAIRAVPAGLAVVGVGLLENLSANRAVLTYLGLALVALWLLIRFRSLARALLALVPIGLAVGTSSVVVGAVGLTLSPVTTVSGPLVVASCTEFSVLILARYLEERQSGLGAREASDQAAARTGRAFFTSAVTTIGGFAVLIGSALPLLRDFGIIVTLNVAVALLAALVVMPPLLVWADDRGFLTTGDVDIERSVVLGAKPVGARAIAWVGAIIVVGAAATLLYTTSEKTSGEVAELAYAATPLPTTTTTTTTPVDTGAIDVDSFGTVPEDGLIQSTLFGLLVAQGATEQQAVCAGTTVVERVGESELLALGLAEFAPEALAPVIQAGLDCGIDQPIIDATIDAGLGG